MKMQKTGNKNTAFIIKPGLYKLAMTLCFALIISMFLFSCGGAKESSANEDTTSVPVSDTNNMVPADTSSRLSDTTRTLPPDSAINK